MAYTVALTTFIENGFQQNLKTGAVFLDLTAAYDTVQAVEHHDAELVHDSLRNIQPT